MALFGVASSVVAYLIGIPVLQIIYNVNLEEYRWMLIIIIISATLYNIAMMYSNILTTMRYTRIQFIAYFVDTIIAFIISNVLTRMHGIQGATNAYFLIMLTLFLLYTVMEKIVIKKMKRIEKGEIK